MNVPTQQRTYRYVGIWAVACFTPRVPGAVHAEWMMVFSMCVIECTGWECLVGGRLNMFPEWRVTLRFSLPSHCARIAFVCPVSSWPAFRSTQSGASLCLHTLPVIAAPLQRILQKKTPPPPCLPSCLWCRDAFKTSVSVSHSPLSLTLLPRRKGAARISRTQTHGRFSWLDYLHLLWRCSEPAHC